MSALGDTADTMKKRRKVDDAHNTPAACEPNPSQSNQPAGGNAAVLAGMGGNAAVSPGTASGAMATVASWHKVHDVIDAANELRYSTVLYTYY